jgi:hypothetical protein
MKDVHKEVLYAGSWLKPPTSSTIPSFVLCSSEPPKSLLFICTKPLSSAASRDSKHSSITLLAATEMARRMAIPFSTTQACFEGASDCVADVTDGLSTVVQFLLSMKQK